jgi:hypothetical protein
MFVNHGCNGTYNFGEWSDITEVTADPNEVRYDFFQRADNDKIYNPAKDRYAIPVSGDWNLLPISKGEEILLNYLYSFSDPADWKDEILALRAECDGAVGIVEEWNNDNDDGPVPDGGAVGSVEEWNNDDDDDDDDDQVLDGEAVEIVEEWNNDNDPGLDGGAAGFVEEWNNDNGIDPALDGGAVGLVEEWNNDNDPVLD